MSTRERIFEAAVDLFSRDGFSGVSIREITRAVGIKESSFYNHYHSKEELLNEIFDTYKANFDTIMPPVDLLDQILAIRTPEEFWAKGYELYKKQMGTPLMRKINRILSIEQFRSERARQMILEDMVRKPLAFTEMVFARMVSKKMIRPYDPRILAQEYQMPVFSLSMMYLLLEDAGMDTSEVDQCMADHIRFLGEILKPEPQKE